MSAALSMPIAGPQGGRAAPPLGGREMPGQARPALWIQRSQIRNLPMSGPEWDARPAPWGQNRGVYYYAQQSTAQPVIGFVDDRTDVYVLAKALVWLRLDEEPVPPEDPEPYRAAVQEACLAARETENLGEDQTTLALGRNLLGYVIAASIIDWDDSRQGRRESDFKSWLAAVRTEVFSEGGFVFRNLIDAHETRPNNWGLMCGASRLGAAIYLGDEVDEMRCWEIFRRWLGDATSQFEFSPADWGGLSWQADPLSPVGINPLGSKRLDCGGTLRAIGGAMPDDIRRAGAFPTLAPCDPTWSWPPYTDIIDRNYAWNAMQAVLAQAVLHDRRGRNPWGVGNAAIGRAFLWLYQQLQFPVTDPDAGDDDYWLPHLANRIYPSLSLPEPLPTKPGNQVGYVDWTTLEPSWP